MADLTAIILTKNEEINISKCIESISGFAKRIVVIDSGSTDKTVEIAKSLGADVYINKFIDYATQFNWGIDNTNINTKWILRLDADERVTLKLSEELEKLTSLHTDSDVNGIVLQAYYFFLGKLLKHGFCARKRKLMVFKTGVGRIEQRRMDEHTILNKGITVQAKNRFLHYDNKNLTIFINKLNWYATREMQDYIEFKNGKEQDLKDDKLISKTRKLKYGFYYKFPKFFRSWLLFIYDYIFRLGFLNGREGYMYCYLYSRWYRWLVDAKIMEQIKTNESFEETGDLK